jgi:hypothetical protein
MASITLLTRVEHDILLQSLSAIICPDSVRKMTNGLQIYLDLADPNTHAHLYVDTNLKQESFQP